MGCARPLARSVSNRADQRKPSTTGLTTHTSTSNGDPGSGTSGVALWDSGNIAPGGGTLEFAFSTAGTYPYFCAFHSAFMTGAVQVPPKTLPSSGGTDTPFRIIWGTPPGEFNVDVQIMRPGDPGFSDWKVDQTTNMSPFLPDGGPGAYQFRARLQNAATGGTSDYSPVRTIRVR